MVCIVNFKTKKEMITAVADGKDFVIEDPSIVNPKVFMASEIMDGNSVCVTNHPKRSWFAQIKKQNNKLRVI